MTLAIDMSGKDDVPLLSSSGHPLMIFPPKDHCLRAVAQCRAMTLIEVLVATVILGLGVTALLSAATLAGRNQQRSEWRAMALCVAQEKLAEIELIGPHVWMLARPSSGDVERTAQTFRWTSSIEQQLAGELFSVQVSVEWAADGGGKVELSTWFNDYNASILGASRDRKAKPKKSATSK